MVGLGRAPRHGSTRGQSRARVLARHLRSAYPVYDWFGGMPNVTPAELWAVMDRYETEGSAAFADLPSL